MEEDITTSLMTLLRPCYPLRRRSSDLISAERPHQKHCQIHEVQTYPTLVPIPFDFSTRISNTISPERGSHQTAHQFRRPIMYLFFTRDVPSGSCVKSGIMVSSVLAWCSVLCVLVAKVDTKAITPTGGLQRVAHSDVNHPRGYGRRDARRVDNCTSNDVDHVPVVRGRGDFHNLAILVPEGLQNPDACTVNVSR